MWYNGQTPRESCLAVLAHSQYCTTMMRRWHIGVENIPEARVLLEYLGPLRLLLLPCGSRLPVGAHCLVALDFSENKLANLLTEWHSPLLMFPVNWHWSVQRLCILLLFFETNSFSQLPLLPDSFSFLRVTGPSSSCPLWTVSTSLLQSQPSLVLLTYAG